MGFMYSIVGFFSGGGLAMFPIALVLAVGTAITVERYITLTSLGAKNRRAWAQIQPVLASGDFDKARAMTQNDATAISQLLSSGLARQGSVRRREDVEVAMEECRM